MVHSGNTACTGCQTQNQATTMTQPQRPLLFTVSNHHASPAHEPPSIDGDEPNRYHSYFENSHGEQSLFAYRYDTQEALVYSGDAGWAAFPVVNRNVSGLILSPDEQMWVLACLRAIGADATGNLPFRSPA